MANSGVYDEDYDFSDHESEFADSPADGYFTQREHPEETFVEQSSVQAESEAKAREAAESQTNASQATPPTQQSPTSPVRSPVWAEESTLLLDAGPAPPDYAAATAHRRDTQLAEHERAGANRASDGRPASYGSMDAYDDQRQDQRQWPVGNRENPFNSSDFPFGPRGSLFSSSSFPFGSTGSHFTPQRQQQSMQDAAAHGETEGLDEETGLMTGQQCT